MMDFARSYSARWRVYKVNRKTWADAELVSDIDAISISRNAGGDLIESGSMDVTGSFDNDYYRIAMVAEQGGEVERIDLATMLFQSKDGEHDYGTTKQSVDGNSVLYPASTTTVLIGGYAPAGVDGAAYAGKLLADSINAPVKVEGHFTLDTNIVHELGSYVIDAVWDVLNAGNFCIQIDGRGVVHIRPMPKEPILTIDNSNAKLLTNGIKFSNAESELPNRYIVIVGDSKTIAVNSDPNSRISTVSRGYYVDMVDNSPAPINGETIAAYANRKLRESSILKDERSYTREYAKDVNVNSIVRASINGLEGDLRVISQSFKCEHGIVVEEKANREIKLWQ